MKLVVVSGPSGVGKTTVCDRLLARPEFERVITATTRAPRAGERDGIDYHFLDRVTFDRWIEDDRFLEWADVYGNKYGSPRAEAEAILARGHFALLNIDVQGAATIGAGSLPCVRVFLLPPSDEDLERRLRGRGTDAADVIERRLRIAREELARRDEFDLCVINDDAQRAADEIASAAAR
jgi:guanylate kinase